MAFVYECFLVSTFVDCFVSGDLCQRFTVVQNADVLAIELCVYLCSLCSTDL